MVLDYFGDAEHDGALRIDWGGQYGGLLVFLVCWRRGRYILSDLQGDIRLFFSNLTL